MGMGEPLHNWKAVEEALTTFVSPRGFAWGPRRITLSTCGLAPEIRLLADSGLKPRLAVSLHTGDDKSRTEIMPINRKYDLAELMDACHYYQEKTGLQLTFEVTIFKGINDTAEAAKAISGRVKGLDCKVNLIPYNPVEGLPFEAPQYDDVVKVQMQLKKAGIITMVRTEKGGDIDAACGQLRRREATL
jgi:23S rRNA (adenine2503-C2)-methyltransferase